MRLMRPALRAIVLGGLVAALQTGSVAVAVDEVADERPPEAAVGASLERLADASGADDADELRSLIGPPDAFTVAFEPADDGTLSRREEWFYYDLATGFEFADGQLLSDEPLADVPSMLVHAVTYDPAAFTEGSTWESLGAIIEEPEGFESLTLQEEYDIPATVYVGDFLVLAFDEDGELFFVEAMPLSAEADE